MRILAMLVHTKIMGVEILVCSLNCMIFKSNAEFWVRQIVDFRVTIGSFQRVKYENMLHIMSHLIIFSFLLCSDHNM